LNKNYLEKSYERRIWIQREALSASLFL
jgi:hypothetical protein